MNKNKKLIELNEEQLNFLIKAVESDIENIEEELDIAKKLYTRLVNLYKDKSDGKRNDRSVWK